MGATTSAIQLTYEIQQLYESLESSKEEKRKKAELIKVLEDCIHSKYPSCSIRPFGSTESGLGFHDSDLDIGIFFTSDELTLETNNSIFRSILGLVSHRFHVLQFIDKARVPVLKLWDPVFQISCDITIGNTLALLNTALIKAYGSLDPRFKPLVFSIKYWARQRGINDAANGSLSSYAYVLLLIHFLQRRRNPILPYVPSTVDKFFSIEKLELMDTFIHTHSVKCGIHQSHGTAKNTDPTGELLLEFFQYYANHFDIENMVVSIREHEELTKEKRWSESISWRFSIEDPFDPHHDVGKVIFCQQAQSMITSEFRRAITLLSSPTRTFSKLFELVDKSTCYICKETYHQPRYCPVLWYRRSITCGDDRSSEVDQTEQNSRNQRLRACTV